MGKMMISLSDEAEARLRRAASAPPFNDKIGAISMVVENALRAHIPPSTKAKYTRGSKNPP